MNAKTRGFDMLGGILIGVASTYVMTVFQSRSSGLVERFLSRNPSKNEKQENASNDPSTVKVANRIYQSIAHHSLPEQAKSNAGQLVHYGFGTSLGLAYAVLSRAKMPDGLISGAIFGAAIWLLADELMLWALGLAQAPTKYPTKSHVYALASHLVYGAALGSGTRMLHRED